MITGENRVRRNIRGKDRTVIMEKEGMLQDGNITGTIQYFSNLLIYS